VLLLAYSWIILEMLIVRWSIMCGRLSTSAVYSPRVIMLAVEGHACSIVLRTTWSTSSRVTLCVCVIMRVFMSVDSVIL
jgi:hypothetical protein